MPHFFPVHAPLAFDCARSDLLRFDWQAKAADFAIPDDEEHVLRVRFAANVIVRILDEMPLSIETDPSASRGLVPHHFAYLVEGAPFSENQPEAWQAALGTMKHYQFVTGWGCLDVLSRSIPVAIRSRPKSLRRRFSLCGVPACHAAGMALRGQPVT